MAPADLRVAIVARAWAAPTSGLAIGHGQANLVALPVADAPDFLRFCELNPQACPVLEVTPPGVPTSAVLAPGADLRRAIPRYNVFHDGELVDEPVDASAHWREDLVAILLGCSLTFEAALLDAGVPMRHLQHGRLGPAYVSLRRCRSAGRFDGPLVVSMRPVPLELVDRAVAVTAGFPGAHGAPVSIGDPDGLGIDELGRPDFGEPPALHPGDVSLFWACGVTPQLAARGAGVELMITHAPGHMLVTDVPADELGDGSWSITVDHN